MISDEERKAYIKKAKKIAAEIKNQEKNNE
jgi:hypothetical protein